jgi:hypothetical protein
MDAGPGRRYIRWVTDTELASARLCTARIRERWGSFQAARGRQLAAVGAGQVPAEKIAENILCELFTRVLDWTTEQVRLQEQRVDLMLTRGGLKYLIVEVKRPGSFDGRGPVVRALNQARGYASELRVDRVAVSDACLLEAYDVTADGLRPRAVVHLASPEPAEDLWWLSTRGIYRTPPPRPALANAELADGTLLDRKYGLPARCFAYVGDPARPTTWKLPYLLADGEVNAKRLPAAIGAVIRDYRSQQVKGVPEDQIPDVLVRLAAAAVRIGRMPHQDPTPADTYVALLDRLRQLGRTADVPGLVG